jgi:hypothetical protein
MIAICRTPGYWMTHAGTEKGKGKGNGKSPINVTLEVINRCGGCLEVCGTDIKDTSLCSTDSALEAMCDNTGKPFFHLTAMALNCCISGFGSDCATGGDYLSQLFIDANSSCEVGGSYRQDEADCFNNGGEWYEGKCKYYKCNGTGDYCTPGITDCDCMRFDNCHDRELCWEGDPEDCYESPAGSSCKPAKDNSCTVSPDGGFCD